MGKDSKVILLGDISQYDIKGSESGLTAFKDMVRPIEGVAEFQFGKEDIQRDKILIDITDRYEKMIHEAKQTGKPITNKRNVGSL
jgi:phosphate starvation-inducible protein PhoH